MASYDNTGHVLVTTGDRDIGIVELSTCNGLDAVGNKLSSLERETHAFAAPTSCQYEPIISGRHTYMVIPSETPTVPYCHPSIPCFSTACLAVLPRSYTDLLVRFCSTKPVETTYSACYRQVSVQQGQAERSSAYLHGLPSHHTQAIPTCGAFFIICSFGTPAAYSMA